MKQRNMKKSLKGMLLGCLISFGFYLYIFALPLGKIQDKDFIWGFFFSFPGMIIGYLIGKGIEKN